MNRMFHGIMLMGLAAAVFAEPSVPQKESGGAPRDEGVEAQGPHKDMGEAGDASGPDGRPGRRRARRFSRRMGKKQRPPAKRAVETQKAEDDSGGVQARRNRAYEKLGRRVARNPNLSRRGEQLEALGALGYLPGGDTAQEVFGVLRHDTTAAAPGLNLFVSSHAAVAVLMDMAGEPVHQWCRDFFDVWPRRAVSLREKPPMNWRRVHLFPNGDLLAIFSYHGLVKINAASEVIWDLPGNFHHDVAVGADDTVYAIERNTTSVKSLRPPRNAEMDYITLIGPDGDVRERLPLIKFFEHSHYAPMIASFEVRMEVFHTNTLVWLDGTQANRLAAFKRGNLLICPRDIDILAVLDMETRKVDWVATGMWHLAHEPVLLDTGNILLFDNLYKEDQSRVIEFDPVSQDVVWAYGMEEDEKFFTRVVGFVRRLSNGNTLITVTNEGRIIEVSPEKKVVWEFMTPHTIGEDAAVVAKVPQCERLELDPRPDWIDETTTAVKPVLWWEPAPADSDVEEDRQEQKRAEDEQSETPAAPAP